MKKLILTHKDEILFARDKRLITNEYFIAKQNFYKHK